MLVYGVEISDEEIREMRDGVFLERPSELQRERKRIYDKRYYMRHREEIREKKRKYREANRERIRRQQRDRYANDAEYRKRKIEYARKRKEIMSVGNMEERE